jgi:hypothetical protein
MRARQRWWTHTRPIRGSCRLFSPGATGLCIHFSHDDFCKSRFAEDVSHTRIYRVLPCILAGSWRGLIVAIPQCLTNIPRPPTARAADTGGQRTEISGHGADNLENVPALGLSGFSAGTRKPNRPIASTQNLDGHALNGRSETALYFAVVRSFHSRPASFRCRFQNARSVRLSDSPLCAKNWPTRRTTDA